LSTTVFGASNTTCDAVASTNTVTPSDISGFEAGDRLIINGADTAGGNLACVVRTIDRDAGTFTALPSIKTDVTGATTIFDGASTSAWRIMPRGSGNGNIDVVGNPGNGVSGRFESEGSVTVANSATGTIATLSNRSTYLLHIRKTSDSSDFKSVIIGTGFSTIDIDERITNGTGYSLTSSGLDLQVSNSSGSSETYAFSMIQLKS
jgi:hypothetical protein